MYTLDTNVLIYHFRGDTEATKSLEYLLKNENSFFISIITKIELFCYPEITQKEITLFKDFLQNAVVIYLDNTIADFVTEIRKNYKLKLPDATIAATAIYTNSTLITRNIKDFEKIKKLDIIKI